MDGSVERHLGLKTLNDGVQAVIYENGFIADLMFGDSLRDVVEMVKLNYPELAAHTVIAVDRYTQQHENEWPDVDAAVDDILKEVAELRVLGRIVPFVEGEPIGVIPRENRADLQGRNGRGGWLHQKWFDDEREDEWQKKSKKVVPAKNARI